MVSVSFTEIFNFNKSDNSLLFFILTATFSILLFIKIIFKDYVFTIDNKEFSWKGYVFYYFQEFLFFD